LQCLGTTHQRQIGGLAAVFDGFSTTINFLGLLKHSHVSSLIAVFVDRSSYVE
jgi:hypothetical protein